MQSTSVETFESGCDDVGRSFLRRICSIVGEGEARHEMFVGCDASIAECGGDEGSKSSASHGVEIISIRVPMASGGKERGS